MPYFNQPNTWLFEEMFNRREKTFPWWGGEGNAGFQAT